MDNEFKKSGLTGGGIKKVLYSLNTARKIGLRKTSKALLGKNTCKACGLGMGGQMGGMTNELGEFPSVCNKSIQAQSSDTQAAIPTEVFDHSIDEIAKLSGYELEHLGRLNTPLHKTGNSNHYQPVSWEFALKRASQRFLSTPPERSFFYSSGRSSNEAGFILQLLARVYGTNNVNNCSYYCHQATSVALATTIGTGTSTIKLEDLAECDLIFVIGANPASNHPRFIYNLTKCRSRGGRVIIINPAIEPGLIKFSLPKSPKSLITGGTEVASDYIQPRIGTDMALFKGIAKAIIDTEMHDQSFIDENTDGFESFAKDIANTSWEEITSLCGVSQDNIETIATHYANADKVVFAWGMGMTHHLNGVDNIEYIANIALLRGMLGKQNAGLLPLRGHSNVQGIGTVGVKPELADTVLDNMINTLGITIPETEGLDTMGAMQRAYSGVIDAALIMGGNLYGANPDSGWAKKALENIDFKLFLTTTINKGHVGAIGDGESIILPVAARDEEWQPTTQESMFNFVRLSDGGITRLDNVRPESAVLCELAQKVVPNGPINWNAYSNHQKIREAIAKIIPGMEEAESIEKTKKEFYVGGRTISLGGFNTPTRKAAFQVRPLPSQRQKDQLILTTVRSEGQFNTIIYEESDVYRGVIGRWCVMMSPHDMESRGLQQGDLITLRSDNGRMESVTLYTHQLALGSVMAYFPEANVLTGSTVDPRSKTPSFKATPVWIEKRQNG